MEEGYKAIKELGNRIFKFLKEGKNLGAVTWLTTVFATLSVALLKFFGFVFESGKLKYWGISTSVINVAGDGVLYDIIVTIILAAVVFFLLLIPYFIIKSSAKKLNKAIVLSIIALILSVVFFFGSNARLIIHNSFWTGTLVFLAADILFLGMFFAPTAAFLIVTRPQKNESKQLTPKRAIVLVVVLAAANILYFYGTGCWAAKTETRYRITTDEYAIIYETNNSYYVAKYDQSKNEIIKNQQKIIGKENVEYTWKSDIGVK